MAKMYAMAFWMLSKNPPPQLDRLHDGREVVIQEHQGSRFARHVRASSAHGDADMRGFQGGRVVDAVTGHRHHFALGFERLNDAQLLLRHDSGE